MTVQERMRFVKRFIPDSAPPVEEWPEWVCELADRIQFGRFFEGRDAGIDHALKCVREDLDKLSSKIL